MKKILPFLFLFLFISCEEKTNNENHQDDRYHGDVFVSELFNVSGATALVSAERPVLSNEGSMVVRHEILKRMSDGTYVSAMGKIKEGSRMQISVLETAQDGSIYIGLEHSEWLIDDKTGEGAHVSLLKINPNGYTEIFDKQVRGMSYSFDRNRSSADRQIQFDNIGNIYYRAWQDETWVLKKRSLDGSISQIGNYRMNIHSFQVSPEGIVVFHGQNNKESNSEWLKVYENGVVKNIFYPDLSWDRIRFYHLQGRELLIFGNDLNLFNSDQNLTGLIKVDIEKEETKLLVNMKENYWYSNNGSVAELLLYSRWVSDVGYINDFFESEPGNEGHVASPLTLKVDATWGKVENWIEDQLIGVKRGDLQGLDLLGVEGTIEEMIEDVNRRINLHLGIKFYTFQEWKLLNNLENFYLNSPKKFHLSTNGSLYVVVDKHDWNNNSSESKLIRLLDLNGTPSLSIWEQDDNFKSIDKSILVDNHLVYLSKKAGQSKIFTLNLNIHSAPEELHQPVEDLEIFGFTWCEQMEELIYDVYDYSVNSSYLVRQKLNEEPIYQKNLEGIRVIQAIPFSSP